MGHTPEFPSSLSDDCPDVLGQVLALRCVNGWGWLHCSPTAVERVEDRRLIDATLEIVAEAYVAVTRPRSGIAGRVVRAPDGYDFHRFVAVIMSDGCDYDFSNQVAPAWQVWLGDGGAGYVETEAGSFPTMTGTEIYHGYGSIAVPGYWAGKNESQPSGLG